MLITEYQEHGGAVNTDTSLKVQYTYSEMASSANHSRLTSVIYPGAGSTVAYNYASGLDTAISRLTSMVSDSVTLESYLYLGLGTVVRRSHPHPGVDLSYIKLSGEGIGDAGDKYTCHDRFGWHTKLEVIAKPQALRLPRQRQLVSLTSVEIQFPHPRASKIRIASSLTVSGQRETILLRS